MSPEEQKALDKLVSKLVPQVEKLAREAVKKDGWMVPSLEGVSLPYSEYQEAVISGWSSTDQYNIRWRQQIIDMVKDALVDARLILSGGDNLELVYSVVGDLETNFWEAWCTGHKLLRFWEKQQPKKGKHEKD